MKVLVLGGTGYIGSAVVSSLRSAGHDAVPVSRTPDPSDPSSLSGDLADPASLAALVTPDVDAVVHAAAPSIGWDVQQEGVRALVAALDGRRLVYTSGIWALGATTEPATESSPVNPIPLVTGRPAVERLVTDAGGVVIRPGVVHGEGKGLLALLDGRYVGDESTTWPMVHVGDLGALYLLALEQAEAGSVLHGVAEPAVRVADIAASSHGTATPWPDAADELGPDFAEALGLSQVVGSPAATALGWVPRHPGAVEEAARTAVRAG